MKETAENSHTKGDLQTTADNGIRLGVKSAGESRHLLALKQACGRTTRACDRKEGCYLPSRMRGWSQ